MKNAIGRRGVIAESVISSECRSSDANIQPHHDLSQAGHRSHKTVIRREFGAPPFSD
jgi:hypothetical protein